MVATGLPAPSVLGTARVQRTRKLVNACMTASFVLAFVAVVVPLGFILFYVVKKGASVVDADFLTRPIPVQSRFPGGGMGPAVVGTLLITAAATVLAVPLGVLGGVYLNEYGGPGRLARVVRFLADVMTGVPSIVMGLFIFTVYVLRFGFSGFAGALGLACLMLPVVIRSTEEMLKLVPRELRDASFALGGRKAKTIGRVILPAAAPGIVSGALLAVARAAGETAPLLFTILTVNEVNANIFHGPNTALSVQIFRNASALFPAQQARGWGAALTLVAIVFVFTVAARVVTAVFSRKVVAQ
ncbi:MAG: phosphate ABC transporter permease PstA [Acidimicrobiia bacterium]